MKLSNALVCVTCDELVEIGQYVCPSCTSRSLVLLSQWIKPLVLIPEVEPDGKAK